MRPTFAEAARFWVQLGFVSFGGPAGQIAILHRELVERRGWLDDRAFAGALNFCMLLPGPEALQLAIFLGWKLHGVRGAIVAGLGFIVPAIVLLFGLSLAYVTYGSLPWMAGVLFGLKAAVVALVLQALARIARKALGSALHIALAVASFVALQWLGVPFPVVIGLAAALGWFTARAGSVTAPADPPGGTSGQPWVVAASGVALWLVPWSLVVATLGLDSLWAHVYVFFTKAALVTFGGAYAVLPYVTDQLVEHLGWISAEQAVAGLALAETTPGPLVIVLQFMGFMAGWNQPGPLGSLESALLAGALAAWATFLPSFILILLGAPYVDRLNRNLRASAALGAITAAVVGVIATLALLLVQLVLLPDGWRAAPHWGAVTLAAAAWYALERRQWPLPLVLAAAAVIGLLGSVRFF